MWLSQAVEGNTWQGEQTAPSCLKDTIKSVTALEANFPCLWTCVPLHQQNTSSSACHRSQRTPSSPTPFLQLTAHFPRWDGHDIADLPQVGGSKGPVISYSPTKSWEMAGTASEPTWAAEQLLSSKINFAGSAKLGICVRFCMTKKKKKDLRTIPYYNLGAKIRRHFFLTSQDLAPAPEKNPTN